MEAELDGLRQRSRSVVSLAVLKQHRPILLLGLQGECGSGVDFLLENLRVK